MSVICTVAAICVGLGALVWCLRHVRQEAQLAWRREAEARHAARLRLEQMVADERVIAAEQAARRQAMDEFLSSIHAEERAFVRQRKLGPHHTRSVVLEERLYLRNIPVSNWSQQELTFYTTSGTPHTA